MWYVIWTSTGSEEKASESVRELPCQTRCFVPRRAVQIRRAGEWIREEKPLFPGYFFVDTEDPDALSDEIRKLEGFHKILTTEKKFSPVYGDDVELIENMYGTDGLFDFSEGIIEGDRIVVTSGPLMGQEGRIKKIDRHKRLAYLEFEMFDQTIKVSVGLEIVEKH